MITVCIKTLDKLLCVSYKVPKFHLDWPLLSLLFLSFFPSLSPYGFSELPRGGTGFSYYQTGFHLIGVYRVPRAGLEPWLGVHLTSFLLFSEPPPEGGVDLVTNRQGFSRGGQKTI